MKNKAWKTLYIFGIIILIIWSILLINNIIQTKKLVNELNSYKSQNNSQNIGILDNQDTEEDWCYMQTSWDGTKYCSDIQGWHFDFCNNVEYYTWRCSTKEDVEEKRTLHENICISIRNVCPDGYTCKSSDSPKSVSCQKVN